MDRATWQIIEFFSCLGLGFVLGILYDFYRVWFRHGRTKLVIAIGDGIFAFVALVLTFVALLCLNWAEIRFYIILALGLGILIYLKWVSPRLLPFWQRFFGLFYKLLKAILKFLGRAVLIIIKPVIWLSILLYRILYFIMWILGLTGKKFNQGMQYVNKKNHKKMGKFKNKLKNLAGKFKRPKNTNL